MDHHPLKNSSHATTSSAATTTAMTATQMRATLIYLAPFLQPCKKNVATKTRTQQQKLQQQTQHNELSKTATLQQQHHSERQHHHSDKTHVPHNRVSSSRSNNHNHNNAINCNNNNNTDNNWTNNTITKNNDNTNTNTNTNTMNSVSLRCCIDNIPYLPQDSRCHSPHSRGSSCASVSSSRSGTCTISTSCCLNNNVIQQQQLQDSKQVKDQHKKHKDTTKYYKNYEKMPALETNTTKTTNTTTTTMLCSNERQQQKQHLLVPQEVALVVVAKQDNPSLSFETKTSSLSTLCCTSPSSAASTNSRSTKYLWERVRRINMQQQQQHLQQQTTHGLKVLQNVFLTPLTSLSSSSSSKLPPLMALEHKVETEEEIEVDDDEVKEKEQRKSPCGRGILHINDKRIAATPSWSSMDTSQTITGLSRCHCLKEEQQQHNNNIMPLLNSQDDMTQNCDDAPFLKLKESGNTDSEHTSLILRNSQRMEEKEQVEQPLLEKLKNSYLYYKQKQEDKLFYTKHELNTTSARNSSSLSSLLSISSPSSSSSSSSSSPSSSSTLSSYTTILNKECRCFINKRDIIGSECNLVKKLSNSMELSNSTGVGTTAATSLSDSSYCMINKANSGISSPASSASSLQVSSSPTSSYNCNSIVTTCQWLLALFGCSKLTKTVAVSKWLFMWLLFIICTSSAHCWAGRNDVPTNCTFPVRWEGSWFLSGYQQSIHIKGSQFSYRGRCAASDGNKYLIVDEKGCHRCLVIYEKHKNVLQYKESECEGDSMYMHQTNPSAMAMRSVLNQKTNNNGGDHRGGAHPNLNGHSRLSSSDQYIMRSNDDMNDYFCKGRETLQNLCDQIPGDALLYSLFRESAEPVKCPLKGPFIFTYNRGNGECKSPVSNIESCTEDSRLLLSFQACPDVVGTESTVEELTCLATWKDGNSRYLVGLVSHHHAISNEERYRCFVYEKISSLMDLGHFAGPSMSTSKDAEYKLAQSGDATCNGLDSAEVGSRIMSLRKPPVTERCDFPVWFKGPRHWHVLMGNAVYNYHTNDGSIHIIKPNGYMETRALCEQINKQTSTEMMSVVHYTTGCQSGFMCMMFYRRDTHVIEIQTGKPASRLEDACAPDHFDINKTPYITLLASNPDPQICPMEGLYSLKGAIGPPYLTTRHKRNHNNKVHGLHNHHHQFDSLENNGRGYLHKRHSSLSFRTAQHDEKSAWHSNTRGLPIRSRRDASSTAIPVALSPSSVALANQTQLATSNQEILVVGNSTSVGFVQDPNSDTRLRSRRNVPECVTNCKASRQLWVGCTEPNVIDVRPLCNDEGDEEYSCHGSWSENGTVYIIARHKGTKHGVCISYRPTEGTSAKLVVGDACYRGTQKPPEHHLVANLSVFGKCGETGSTSSTIPVISWSNLIVTTILITFLSQLPIQR